MNARHPDHGSRSRAGVPEEVESSELVSKYTLQEM